MLRGRLALASVYWCFVCLLSITTQPAARPCSQDLILKVQLLIKRAPSLKWLDCRLYTPTISDYKQKCPRSTLKCFADEIKVLIEEWQTQDSRLNRVRLHMKLESLATSFNQTESECRQCELLKEENAEKFLKDLELTLKIMNSVHCPNRTTLHAGSMNKGLSKRDFMTHFPLH